jgi:hypothetical protein
MRKEDVEVGGIYAADGPGETWSCAKVVQVKVIELRQRVRVSRRATAAGVLVELQEDATLRKTFGDEERVEKGTRYELPNRRLLHDWTEADDEAKLRAEASRSMRATISEKLIALGLPAARAGYEVRRAALEDGSYDPDRDVTLTGYEDEEGFNVRRDETVVIDNEILLAWLARIDPLKIAGEAIEEYVRLEGQRLGGQMLFAASRDTVLAEIAQGIAVTDAELKP